MKHIILTGIDETGDYVNLMVDGSKILSALDTLKTNSQFDHTTIILDNSVKPLTFDVMEQAVDIMKKIDECDKLNRR